MSLSAFILRKMFARSDARRDAGLQIPDSVSYLRGLSYGPDPVYHTLDICFPKGQKDKLPLIISFHGGGYVYGSTKEYQFYCADLARRGFCVANFNYRLAPRYRFPTPLEDLNTVIGWLIQHQAEYPLDLNNVFLIGDSAGAQMTSQYAALYASPAYQQVMNITPPPFRLAGIGLCCGMYDLKSADAQKGLGGVKKDYFTAHPEQFGEKLNVLSYIDSHYPPVFIFSAPGDFLLAHCKPMAELLTGRGVRCECRIYGDQTTGHVFHLNIRSDLARQANDEQTGFLRQFIRPAESIVSEG